MSEANRATSTRGDRGTLLALHGHGDTTDNALRWATRMAPRGWSVEVVGSPRDSSGEASWFETGPMGADPGDLSRSVDAVSDVVRSAAASGPVVVAGFSQGGALALALPRLRGLEAVVSVCGFLPEVDDLDLGDGPPALLVGTTADEVVPAFLSTDAAAVMGMEGRRALAVEVGGGHEVSPRAVATARRWIEDRLVPHLRFSVGLPTERVHAVEEFITGEAIAETAAHWESLGFDALYVTDHPAPDDRWLAAGGHHALEPTVALATAGAATSQILLHTHVYVLGYRNPFLAAKGLASLDVVTGGRLVLGVAAGYLRPEFEALGADFDERGDRLEESLELLGRIWSGGSVGVTGSSYSARSATSLPVPTQRPHPPIWVGGNSRAAMRRAVLHGQGWSPFPTPGGLDRATRTASIGSLDELGERLDLFGALCEEHDRTERPTVCFSPFALGDYVANPDDALPRLADECEELFSMGVDWVTLAVPGTSRSEVLERADALAAALTPVSVP